eukprot:Gregarina_sp_Pseudo_9__4630@NODE_481_length_2738_cov_16_530937_g453_i0_p1_GENE_NODE_481_length_2738_cov_16_530937_g453_i0NODE_481_length_2738_cov_16_530937_g453_i0_p1_ORF_typecomplete_len816_score278_55MCM/PF00493_23/2_2e03MCM/PF00493_23/3_3e93MCM_lid/PF17855_1/3_3e28MCM_OB/PF17207_3/1_3e25Mg_chelatase/PF01078_21/1_8e06Sigma54_activat/PF00158_26/0_00093MCM_N/PF14551_6/36MCM_N/PF14551_6/0_12AAA_5/PF07728_14/0_0056AAA_3/PF07726_11/0_012RuvB_N/PF05496_12/0_02AAA_2/PF07724_14/0_024DUF3987/PF13148_6/
MATAGSGGPESELISPVEFRQGFEYFLLAFSLGENEERVYRAQIRALSLTPFAGSSNVEETLMDGENAILRLHLEHLRMPHWLPGGVRAVQGMELQDWDAPSELSDLRRACEGLYSALSALPFRYLPIAETVVRDIYCFLEHATDVAAREGGDAAPGSLMEEALSRGVERILSQIPAVKVTLARMLPFQIEVICRDAPVQIRDLKSSMIQRLLVVPGIVVQAAKPFLKASVLVVQCKDCAARRTLRLPPWKQGLALPRNCDGGAGGDAGDAQKCSLDPFVIVSEECSFIDVQTLKIQELPDDVPTGDIPRHLMLNVPSGLVGRVSPGAKILACGVYSAFDKGTNKKGGLLEASVRSGYLHVLGLEGMAKEVADAMMRGGFSLSPGLTFTCGTGFSAADVEAFHRLAARPDIADFVAASIAPSIYGSEDIKRSVACMLFGGSRKYLSDGSSLRGDIHLLLLGDPSTAKSQILKFVERTAPVAVYTSGKGSSAAGLTAALVRDNSGNYALEGGAMVLADGGVVCIDEFDKMRDDDRVAIHEAMEQQTISIAKAGINTVLTTQCAVLAAANPTFGCYDDTKDASEQHNFEATILSRFDCIWLVRDEKNVEKDRVIAQHIFNLYTNNRNAGTGASSTSPDQVIPPKLLRAYISYCRANCQPRLSPDAAKQLENFYVEVREKSRSDRRNRKDQIPITVRQLESLARLAESFAKMSLAPHASMAHVEEAIRLFKVSTVATAQSTLTSQTLTPEDQDKVQACETALLQRLPLGARAAKTTIVRDLRTRGFDPLIIAKALCALIRKGVLAERGDASVRREAGA